MKNKLTLHYVIAVAAIVVLSWAVYLLVQNPERTKSLMITIVGCLVVIVGQFLIIRQKKSR